jgi:hypothetical protein
VKTTSIAAVLILGTTALARPALADDAKSFTALKDVHAQALSATEMKKITGQGLSSMTADVLKNIGQALQTAARGG